MNWIRWSLLAVAMIALTLPANTASAFGHRRCGGCEKCQREPRCHRERHCCLFGRRHCHEETQFVSAKGPIQGPVQAPFKSPVQVGPEKQVPGVIAPRPTQLPAEQPGRGLNAPPPPGNST